MLSTHAAPKDNHKIKEKDDPTLETDEKLKALALAQDKLKDDECFASSKKRC